MNDTFLMLDDDARESAVRKVLGSNLRRTRVARHLSLSELARATDMSKATLSVIESGRANPTIETLAALARALHVSFTELLEEPTLGEIRVVRSTRTQTQHDDAVRALEESSSAGGFDVLELALGARQLYALDAKPVGARAHLYVLAGSLIAGPAERYTELASGDYASFPADVAQIYEAVRRPARALLLTQVPNR